MNIKLRMYYIIVSFTALFFGLTIYIVFRKDTHIYEFFSNMFFSTSYIVKNSFFINFLRYYLVDYLWAFSLAYFLSAVSYSLSVKKYIFNSVISVFVGFLFELAQKFLLISGTADFWDIIMYVSAGLTHAVLNIVIFYKAKSRKEKL